MSNRRKAPADAPSSLKVPGWGREQAELERAEEERWAALAGPVTTRLVPVPGRDKE